MILFREDIDVKNNILIINVVNVFLNNKKIYIYIILNKEIRFE